MLIVLKRQQRNRNASAHLERDLKALETSRFEANREFMKGVMPILQTARSAHQNYHAGELSLEELQQLRPQVESELERVLYNQPKKGWPADAQGLSNRLHRHWNEWFTFSPHPEVKPDNNDAERALRPVVIHRQVSGGARSDWGAQLVAQMFSFLETMRLQGDDALSEAAPSATAQLCELLSLAGRSPPGLHST